MTQDPLRSAAAVPRVPTAFVVVLTAMSVLPVSIYLPALTTIADDLDAGFGLVGLSVAGYAAATALTEVVAGVLSDRLGRRPVALTSLGVFVLASLGCAVAPSIEVFLVCRFLQAAVAACFSVAMVVVRETSDEAGAVRRMGLAGIGWALAPMSAPALGGVLAGLVGWRGIFHVLALLGALVLVAAVRLLPETSRRGRHPAGARPGARVVLRSRAFWACTACLACSTGTLYVFLAGAPLVMSGRLGGSTVALGLLMAFVPGGFVLGSSLVGPLTSRTTTTQLLLGARALTCLGLAVGAGLAAVDRLSGVGFFVCCAVIGIGNGLTTPVVTASVMSAHPEQAGTATGLSAAASIAGGAAVAAAAGLALGAGSTPSVLLGLLLVPALAALGAAAYVAAVRGQEERAAGRVRG